MDTKKNVIKIAVLGDTMVGKTAICNSALDLEFTKDMLQTIGIDRLEISMTLKNGNDIKVILWDTAGAERYRSTSLKILNFSYSIILVFDLTNRKSFENLDTWIKDIKKYSHISSLILFGNKVDVDKNRWQITPEEAKNYAEKMKIPYFETSAKTGQGIKEGISYLVNETYEIMEKNPNGIKIEEKINDEDKAKCIGKNKK